MDIRSLHKEGHSIKAMARMTGRSRNTVRRVLREAGFTSFHKPQRASCLDSHKPYLRQRYEECGLSAVRLLPEIQAMGYTGSLATVRLAQGKTWHFATCLRIRGQPLAGHLTLRRSSRNVYTRGQMAFLVAPPREPR